MYDSVQNDVCLFAIFLSWKFEPYSTVIFSCRSDEYDCAG